jgi:hypothetical protein
MSSTYFPVFRLKVQQSGSTCFFELTWGQAQSRSVQVEYPVKLEQKYHHWQQAYLDYYRSAQLQAYLDYYRSAQLRGYVVNVEVETILIDWRDRLSDAEAELKHAFSHWLHSAELYDIRARLVQEMRQYQQTLPAMQAMSVFLTCAPMALDRLPWELWSMEDIAPSTVIRWIRAPLNITQPPVTPPPNQHHQRPRILAILGDDTGLNFKADIEAVESLKPYAEVVFKGWQPQKKPAEVIGEITRAIADPLGWDMLFFAGHSNEADLVGGKLGIAPNVSINIKDITPQLQMAKNNGLQVAVFNSCSGLSLANALIDLGLGQVVVMREPVHNRVAQIFLVGLLDGLVKEQDLYDALQTAKQSLDSNHSTIYPSASLVPSLFCHPGSVLFRMRVTPPDPPLEEEGGWTWKKLSLLTGALVITLGVVAGSSYLLWQNYAKQRLDEAVALAKRQQFNAAIVLASQIPASATTFSEAQELIGGPWSKAVLDEASRLYQSKTDKKNQAIQLAQQLIDRLPKGHPFRPEVQQKIVQWQQEWTANQKSFDTAVQATKQEKWTSVLNSTDQISHPYWQERSRKLVQTAQERLTAQNASSPEVAPPSSPSSSFRDEPARGSGGESAATSAPAPIPVAPVPVVVPTFIPAQGDTGN